MLSGILPADLRNLLPGRCRDVERVQANSSSRRDRAGRVRLNLGRVARALNVEGLKVEANTANI